MIRPSFAAHRESTSDDPAATAGIDEADEGVQPAFGESVTTPRFDHFIITRFNLRTSDEQDCPAAGADWLRHRLKLFEDVCIPSVLSQTVQHFRWLVLFDHDREQWFDDAVKQLCKDTFVPVWITGAISRAELERVINPLRTRSWLLTSRLDNDDAVSVDFVESLHRHFVAKDRTFINFQSGLQLTEEGLLYHRLDPSNAFISFIERPRAGRFDTVYIDWHNRLAQHGTIVQVGSAPMWLQMIHGNNIANEARGVRAHPRHLADRFVVYRVPRWTSGPRLLTDQAIDGSLLLGRVLIQRHRRQWLLKVMRHKLRTALQPSR